MFRANSTRLSKGTRLLLILAVATSLIWIRALWPDQKLLSITFLDVRQGDCAVIRTPGGRTVLIDAGGSAGYNVGSRVAGQFLRRSGVHTIDLVVITHPHQDHIGGMQSILKEFTVRTALDSGASHPSATYERLLRQISKRKIRYVRAHRGQKISFPDGVKMEVLHPEKSDGPEDLKGESDTNNRSIVLRMTYGSTSFIFTGDAEKEAEETILRSCGRIRSTALKVAHHGAKGATSELWLRAVQPRIAVISVGRFNQFGHPAQETFQRLEESGAQVLRTDKHGAVTLTTDGKSLRVSTARRR